MRRCFRWECEYFFVSHCLCFVFIAHLCILLHCSMFFCSNTVGGDFGDGESKVVRNLTKPPMVNSILEFISESLVFSLHLCS
jgi:hypothetical protein